MSLQRPMWCDDFDADLPKVVPDARAALGDVGDLMLRTHASLAANGMMSHPSTWNHELGSVAFFWRADRPTSKPANYWTGDPIVDLTLWEAVRDAWVHSYVILLEDVWVFHGEAAQKHFDPLMWHVRKWPGVSDEDAAAARVGAVLTIEHTRAKVRTLLRQHADLTADRNLRPAVTSGEWTNITCDVCGETFSGFHKLNAAADRCCPACYESALEARPCTCVSCADCAGRGFDKDPPARGVFDDATPCDKCDASGIKELCARCRELVALDTARGIRPY